MDEVLLHRIDLVLKHIDEVIDGVAGKTYDDFASSDLNVRATCFSIVQIGEQIRELKKKIGNRFPSIPWDEVLGMRNFVVHEYSRIDVAQVYKTSVEDIPSLKNKFINIRKEIIKPDNN